MIYSLVLPCKNESSTIGSCIRKAKKAMPSLEIIVVDNNSDDDSVKIARKEGAIVISEKKQGYGAALKAGFKKASGGYVFMCDSDGTYDLSEIKKFTKHKGYDIVIGNRFTNMEKGAMPFLHKHIGNPIISFSLRNLFKINVKDTQSGFRMIKKSSYEKLFMKADGMDFASEMLIKAAKNQMKIKDIQIRYGKRHGESKLSTFKDGWRHIRIMLLYSPDYVFLVPGISAFLLGLIILFIFALGPISFLGRILYWHPMIIGSFLAIMGYQLMMLWLYSRTFLINVCDEKPGKLIDKVYSNINLERGILIGIMLLLLSMIFIINLLVQWVKSGYGDIFGMKSLIISLTFFIIGLSTVFSSFFLSMMGLRR